MSRRIRLKIDNVAVQLKSGNYEVKVRNLLLATEPVVFRAIGQDAETARAVAKAFCLDCMNVNVGGVVDSNRSEFRKPE
jgi:hypothetical protein